MVSGKSIHLFCETFQLALNSHLTQMKQWNKQQRYQHYWHLEQGTDKKIV